VNKIEQAYSFWLNDVNHTIQAQRVVCGPSSKRHTLRHRSLAHILPILDSADALGKVTTIIIY
jgi:hypothetical protein